MSEVGARKVRNGQAALAIGADLLGRMDPDSPLIDVMLGELGRLEEGLPRPLPSKLTELTLELHNYRDALAVYRALPPRERGEAAATEFFVAARVLRHTAARPLEELYADAFAAWASEPVRAFRRAA